LKKSGVIVVVAVADGSPVVNGLSGVELTGRKHSGSSRPRAVLHSFSRCFSNFLKQKEKFHFKFVKDYEAQVYFCGL
jgi:hypothetical protein